MLLAAGVWTKRERVKERVRERWSTTLKIESVWRKWAVKEESQKSWNKMDATNPDWGANVYICPQRLSHQHRTNLLCASSLLEPMTFVEKQGNTSATRLKISVAVQFRPKSFVGNRDEGNGNQWEDSTSWLVWSWDYHRARYSTIHTCSRVDFNFRQSSPHSASPRVYEWLHVCVWRRADTLCPTPQQPAPH